MRNALGLMMIGLTGICSPAIGAEVVCIPRAELGETTSGDHLYERDADLKITNLSRIDFDQLTIKSAEGRTSPIVKVGENLYKTAGVGTPYYFITNNSRSIVTELKVEELATYVKILLCKP